MTISISETQSEPLGLLKLLDSERSKVNNELARALAQRGSLGRIVALVANERLVNILFSPAEQLYYISPLLSASTYEQVKNERFVISGSAPFRIARKKDGNIIPALMHESNIQSGKYCFQQYLVGENNPLSWIDVDTNVTADRFVDILRTWTDWDLKLTKVFQERIRCSAQYLADTYAENRPCPTLASDFITWEQSIVEANGHPLHKCRMPVDPRTQPTRANFKRADIAFMAVKRNILDIHGPLETELDPLFAAAGIDSLSAVESSEIVIPVHEHQVNFLLSLPQAANQLRLLPQKIGALGQSSTRTMTAVNSRLAYCAVRAWTSGMLDSTKVVGLRGTPIEILPEVACATGLGDHLGVMIRWDPHHSSLSPVDKDIGYAVTGALQEPAVIGQKGCVAETVFKLTSRSKRVDFLRQYTQLYFDCFLKPLFCNGLLIDAHGQNSLLRFSRATGQLLGFSNRDMSDTRFSRVHFERSTSMVIEERMSHQAMTVVDLLDRAFMIFFVVHLWPLTIALDLHRGSSARSTGTDLLQGRATNKEASDPSDISGFAVIARELHNTLTVYEYLQGKDAVSTTARELSAEARMIWMNEPTWPLQCFISQRMRADWAHRDKFDKASTVPAPNLMIV